MKKGKFQLLILVGVAALAYWVVVSREKQRKEQVYQDNLAAVAHLQQFGGGL